MRVSKDEREQGKIRERNKEGQKKEGQEEPFETALRRTPESSQESVQVTYLETALRRAPASSEE